MSNSLLSKVESYANEHFNGEFTIIKHNNYWHACFGVISNGRRIANMHVGFTFEEVLQTLLDEPIDAFGIPHEDSLFDLHQFKDVYAIKINNKHWLPDYPNLNKDKNQIRTFNTEKKAINEVNFIKKDPKWTNIDLKVVKVEEETFIHCDKGIYKQTIREI